MGVIQSPLLNKILPFPKLTSSVNQIDMPYEQSPAAVPLQTKGIHGFLSILAFGNSLLVFFPEVSNWFSATEASNGYYHVVLTYMISGVCRVVYSY